MLYPHKPGMAQWLNGWAADFARRTPEVLHTATLFAEPGVDTYVREALDEGARVFKAHVQVGGYDPADELLDQAWGTLGRGRGPRRDPLRLRAAPGTHTGTGPIAHVLARHPRLRLIIAHLGMPEYEEFLDLAEHYEQVRLDTTMVFTDFTDTFMPFPAGPTPPGPTRRPHPPGHRLPQHPPPVPAPTPCPGTPGPRTRLATSGMPRQCHHPVRPLRVEHAPHPVSGKSEARQPWHRHDGQALRERALPDIAAWIDATRHAVQNPGPSTVQPLPAARRQHRRPTARRLAYPQTTITR